MISSRKAGALKQVAEEAAERGLPGQIIWQAAHAGKPAEAEACVAETVRRLGSVRHPGQQRRHQPLLR